MGLQIGVVVNDNESEGINVYNVHVFNLYLNYGVTPYIQYMYVRRYQMSSVFIQTCMLASIGYLPFRKKIWSPFFKYNNNNNNSWGSSYCLHTLTIRRRPVPIRYSIDITSKVSNFHSYETGILYIYYNYTYI